MPKFGLSSLVPRHLRGEKGFLDFAISNTFDFFKVLE
jgi:hypothetical protein